jgi:DNA-binding LacI/PurR family transcriptional regulator
VDGVLGGRLATEHLLALGHRRIGIIHGPVERSTGAERLRGYLEALRDHGIRPDPPLIREGNFKQDSGYQHTQALLDLAPQPTALFCTNNLMTVGAIQALQDRKVRMPSDLSLIGYDDLEWWTLTHPPLTTVGQPVYNLGRDAMRLLLAQIGSGGRRRRQRIVLKPELIVRESCGPARAAGRSGSRGRRGASRQERTTR